MSQKKSMKLTVKLTNTDRSWGRSDQRESPLRLQTSFRLTAQALEEMKADDPGFWSQMDATDGMLTPLFLAPEAVSWNTDGFLDGVYWQFGRGRWWAAAYGNAVFADVTYKTTSLGDMPLMIWSAVNGEGTFIPHIAWRAAPY